MFLPVRCAFLAPLLDPGSVLPSTSASLMMRPVFAVCVCAGLRPESLSGTNCSLSNDALAVIDRLDPRCVRCVSPLSGQPLGEPVRHSQDVLRVALSQGGGPPERRLALLDKNRDLYCTTLQVSCSSAALRSDKQDRPPGGGRCGTRFFIATRLLNENMNLPSQVLGSTVSGRPLLPCS
jgi:hypothetical protein